MLYCAAACSLAGRCPTAHIARVNTGVPVSALLTLQHLKVLQGQWELLRLRRCNTSGPTARTRSSGWYQLPKQVRTETLLCSAPAGANCQNRSARQIALQQPVGTNC